MATFYIQLENKLLQISGELTAENISKALGYVPVSPNVTNELSERVDNITFDSLKDNPFLQDGSGELNIVDEVGNIIAKINADGIHSVDFIVGEHRLSDKTDKTYVDEAIKNVKVDLTGYATEEYVNNIDFYNINNNPIVNNGDDKLLFVDESGYIGLQLEEDGLYVKDVIADGHTLSQKADKSDLSNYATKDEVSDLVDMSVVTELQENVDFLVGEDSNKSIRTIANEELAKQLLEGNDNFQTLQELSAWIDEHPESAAAMNEAIQKNAADIQSNVNTITDLDSAYKVADVKVLTDANEYTDNINFYTIKDNPIVDNNDGNLIFVDESGNIGLQLEEDGLYVKDVIADGHTLSQKADKSDLSAYVTADELEGYVKKEAIETYYLELPIDEETGQCLMSGSLTQEQFESISNCSVLIVRTAHVDSEEVLASEDITFNWKISQSEQYEGGSKAYAYSNLHPSLTEGCFVLYAITFNQYEGVCSYELAKKRFVVDTEITDPTDAFISTNSVYELDLSSGTTLENGVITGNITAEEFNQITISKNIIVNTGQFKFSLTQKCTFTDMLVFYGNIYYDGITQRLVLNVKANGNECMYMAQLVPIIYELDLSSGTTDENGRITGNITKEEFNQIIEAETLAIKLGDHKVTFNQKSTSDRQGEYLFYGIYNDYEKEKIVLLIVLHDNNDYVYEIRTQELGGGGSAYSLVNHGTSNTTFTLTPNTFHIWDKVTTLNLDFGQETSGVANEYLFQFTSGSEPTTLILPSTINFNSDFTIEKNKIYQISILNGLGTVMSWEVKVGGEGGSGGNLN